MTRSDRPRRPRRAATDAVEETLDAIDRAQPRLNAFTEILADDAVRQAKALDATDRPVGPLHGLPVVVKDLFDVAGVTTTGACRALVDRPPAEADSDVVAGLRAAGAVIVAKANQDELAGAATGLESGFGPVRNPRGDGRVTGGSSSGSAAAVAAGLVPVAIGSDTGGSLRIPASFCGITALKPTWGRIGLRGAMPMNPGLDCAGPMARSAAECSEVFTVLAADPNGTPDDPVTGLCIGLPAPFFTLVHPETRAGVERAARRFEELGALVEEIGPDDSPELDEGWVGFRHTWTEMARALPELIEDERVTEARRELLAAGRDATGAADAESRARASEIRRSFHRTLERFDALLFPATPCPPPAADDEAAAVEGGTVDVHRGGPSRLTIPVNLSGLPAVAFPVGSSSNDLPLGAQLVGRPGADETLLGAVAALQEVTAWHEQRPPSR